MTKPQIQKVDISTQHVERALVEYLQKFFQGKELTGVDMSIPLSSGNGIFSLQVFYTEKGAAKDNAPTPDMVEPAPKKTRRKK